MEQFRFTSIKIEDIGPFYDLNLTFREKDEAFQDKAEVHIFTGENGTGKTTILQLMAYAFSIEENRNSANINSKIKQNIGFLSVNHQSKLSESDRRDYDAFTFGTTTSLRHVSEAKQRYWQSIHAQNQDFRVALFAYSGYRRINKVELEGIKEQREHPLSNALNFDNTGNPEDILQWIVNTKAAEYIATAQGDHEEAARYKDAIDRLEKAIGQIIGQKVAFILETKPYNVVITLDHERLNFNVLPDGLKSIVSWLADLLMRMDRIRWRNDTPVFERNFILFLDEIDVHMHPAWQRKILPVIQHLFPNAQIFLTTHSPFVIGSVDGAWVYRFEKMNGESALVPGFPVLSDDNKTYEYWLEEVFGIREKYGLVAQQDFEKRRSLLRKQDITPVENEELKKLNEKFGILSADESPLGQRIIEHLKNLKTS